MELIRKLLLSALLACGTVFAAAQSAAVPTDYVLASGDRIRVTVFQSPELSLEVRIPEDGVVAYPLLGPVKLGGLTVAEAQRRVTQALVAGHIVRDPQLSVLVTEFHGNQAAVLGFAVHPGRYALESGATRLSGLMALAGGITADASEMLTVTGVRDGAPFRLTVNFRRLSTGADREHDIVIARDDIVYVARAPQVYVYGEVQHPGPLRLEPGMRLLQALAAAGGPTLRGTQRGIRISRIGTDGQLADTTPGMQETLQPEDVVFVPAALF
jgi:polysaccharide export outer membrane protein